jgi:drug/metabolite transporter (DMT)-like permease
MRQREAVGVLLLSIFIIAAALRDVFLNHVFASLGPFQFAFAAFSTATVCFMTLVLIRAPQELLALRTVWREAIGVNVTSAVAWLAYLGALKRVEPSVVNTIFAGVAPLTVTLLTMLGLGTAASNASRPAEHVAHIGLVGALIFVVWLTLSGHGTPGRAPFPNLAVGVVLAVISGIVITAESVIAKRMNEAGISAGAVVAIRFILITAIAASYLALTETGTPGQGLTSMAALIIAALLLIVVPIYMVQLALARTSPMMTNVILALQPVAVFVAQSSIWRHTPTPYMLGAVGLYAVFAICGVALPVWQTANGRLCDRHVIES